MKTNYKLIFSLLPSMALVSTSVVAQQQPNIVFILADDMGWADLACYGNQHTMTPNIDALAKNGVRFTQAYAACPVCSPTRASILTGKYPARLQLTNFIGGMRTDANSPILPAKFTPYLASSEQTIAELLKEKGYKTGLVGKWHVQNGFQDSIAPWAQGFDQAKVIGKNGLDYYNYSIYLDTYKKEFKDNGTEYMTDKLTDYAVEFIKSNKEKPFFLYMAYSAPHVLIVPKPNKLLKYMQKYEKAKEKFNPYYATMVESLDDGVGRIVETLKSEGKLENTIIVFTSDNGGLGTDELGPTPTSMLPLRAWKGHIYEGGTRVPAIVSWKSNLPEGIVCNSYYSSIDYLPTFCDILGIKEIPSNVDGKSILPLLKNPEKEQDTDRALFWHYPHFSNQLGRPAGSVRVGDYKLVENYETNAVALYNLKDDISESIDISQNMKEKTSEMHKLLVDWRKNVNANMPIRK